MHASHNELLEVIVGFYEKTLDLKTFLRKLTWEVDEDSFKGFQKLLLELEMC